MPMTDFQMGRNQNITEMELRVVNKLVNSSIYYPQSQTAVSLFVEKQLPVKKHEFIHSLGL